MRPSPPILADSVGATRSALERAAANPEAPAVIGWVDITSPNLVDLLEELLPIAPDGLLGVSWSFVSGFANDVCVLRGLRLLADYHVALQPVGSVATSAIRDAVPSLRLIPPR